MRFLSSAAALAAIVSPCLAIPTPSSHIIHEKRDATSFTWLPEARVDGSAIIPVRIGLTQNNLHKADEFLMDVSSPSSPNFGKHWTAEKVHEMFAPSKEAVEAVRAWLVSAGIDESEIVHSENKGWLAMDIPASDAERLFAAEYYEMTHNIKSDMRIGCEQYHVPKHLSEHIDYVTPGVKFSPPLKKRTLERRSTLGRHHWKPPGPMHQFPPSHHPKPPTHPNLPPDLQGCGTNITIECIKFLYKIPNASTIPTSAGNELGIFEEGDFYAQEDLNLYFAQYAPYIPQGTHPILEGIDGAKAPVPFNSSLEGGESLIDFDIGFSLIYPQNIILYQTDDLFYSNEDPVELDGFLNTFLDALDGSYCTYTAYGITGDSPGIDPTYPDPNPGGYKGKLECGVYKPTKVISISYGEGEADLPPNYQKRQCNEWMKLGLQGHSVTVSSGDYGVASYPGDVGSDIGCLGPDSTIYSPDFPVNCPYITGVGATRLYADQTVLDPESALQANLGPGAELFASAGGFANYYSTPSYQKAAVGSYFAHHDPGYPYYFSHNTNDSAIGANGGIYNRGGRGFPDLSANGAQFRAYLDGIDYFWYGTSLAAPIVASMVTLINEQRTAIGKGPVGFLNPTLYENQYTPGFFNDIVNGSNPGCNGVGAPGFHAVPGWDPITGLGTPNYPEMSKVFISLP